MAVYNAIRYDQYFDHGYAGDGWYLISTFTSDGSDTTASFTSGISSTYKEYVFVITGIHPETDNKKFTWQVSIDAGSNYNVATTSTYLQIYNNEADNSRAFQYSTDRDQAQGTGFNVLCNSVGSDADQTCSGLVHLYNPASTTYVKHYMAKMNCQQASDYVVAEQTQGYYNTTSAVNAVQFKFDSGEIQAGKIQMFGVI